MSNLIFTWDIDLAGNSGTHQFNTLNSKFGDGYEQAVSFGINNARKTWSASVTNTKAVVDEIYSFLVVTRAVEPFSITPVPSEPAIKVRCDSEISRKHLGGTAWRINFNLKQVF